MTDGKIQEPIKDELALHRSSISLFARDSICQRGKAAETVDAVRQSYGVMFRGLAQARML